MSEGIEKVRRYIASKHSGERRFGDDDDLFENRLIDSLQFVEFILYIAEVSGTPIDMENLDVHTFRTVARIEKAYFSGEARSAPTGADRPFELTGR